MIYTIFPNDTLEALVKFSISLEGLKVFLAIVRQTWGEKKPSAMMTLDLFSIFTELSTKVIKNTLKKLIKAQMIEHRDSPGLSSNFRVLPVENWLKYD